MTISVEGIWVLFVWLFFNFFFIEKSNYWNMIFFFLFLGTKLNTIYMCMISHVYWNLQLICKAGVCHFKNQTFVNMCFCLYIDNIDGMSAYGKLDIYLNVTSSYDTNWWITKLRCGCYIVWLSSTLMCAFHLHPYVTLLFHECFDFGLGQWVTTRWRMNVSVWRWKVEILLWCCWHLAT